MGIIADILGTVKNTFKIGKLTLDANALTANRTITVPDKDIDLGDVGATPGGENLLVNSGFWFNVTGYISGTVLSNTEYGHDNYKAGGGGCTYTFTQNGNLPIQINVTTGSLVTAIEDFNFADYSGDVTVSWDGTAQARVKNGLTTDLTRESYVASPIVISKTANTGLSIEFGIGTVSKIVVVKGNSAGEWVGYDIDQERLRSKRYNQRLNLHYTAAFAGQSGESHAVPFSFNEMRVTPSPLFISATTNNASVDVYSSGSNYGSLVIISINAGSYYSIFYKALLTARLL